MLSDITSQILDSFVLQIRKKENQARLQRHLVDPTIKYILEKLSTYLLGGAVVLSLIVLLTLTMIFLIAYDMRIRSMRP